MQNIPIMNTVYNFYNIKRGEGKLANLDNEKYPYLSPMDTMPRNGIIVWGLQLYNTTYRLKYQILLL